MAARKKGQVRRSAVLVAEFTIYRPGVVRWCRELSPKTGCEFVLVG